MIQNVLSLLVALSIIGFSAYIGKDTLPGGRSDLPPEEQVVVEESTLPSLVPGEVLEAFSTSTIETQATSSATSSYPSLEEIFAELLETTVETKEIAPTFTLPTFTFTLPRIPLSPSVQKAPDTPLPLSTPAPTPVQTTPTVSTPFKAPPESVDPDIKSDNKTFIKGVIVNILCTQNTGVGIPGTSATGVVIDSRGIIITVAHAAQYYIWNALSSVPGTCTIRTGSPATSRYSAKLIYLPERWAKANKGIVFKGYTTGTGRYDFALLAITGTVAGGAAPNSLSYAPFVSVSKEPRVGDEARAGAYAAEFLTSTQIRESLSPTVVFGEVTEVLSFDQAEIDVIAVNGGIAAQQGSSGGAVLNDDNDFMALITSRSGEKDPALRDLQAVTAHHVRHTFESETGESLDAYLSGNSPSALIELYEENFADDLEGIFESAL